MVDDKELGGLARTKLRNDITKKIENRMANASHLPSNEMRDVIIEALCDVLAIMIWRLVSPDEHDRAVKSVVPHIETELKKATQRSTTSS